MLRVIVLASLLATTARTEKPEFLSRSRFSARDSLSVGVEPSDDARACLKQLTWQPVAFEVRCSSARAGRGDALVRFDSPLPQGEATNDLVAMEWYLARDKQCKPIRARAIVVVHESGSSMIVGRLFARKLKDEGLHAFLVQLPLYGERRGPGGRPDGKALFPTFRQAVGDVRRARDAVAALPLIDSSHISLQGTSLGGFVAATCAGLDAGFDSVFLVLAGGDLHDLVQHGQKDTARIREKLTRAGITGNKLKALAETIEPTRLAHRLDPARTWLFSGVNDTVVPMKNALVLARAARLTRNHHVRLPTNHYTGIIFLPSMCQLINKQVQSLPGRPPARADN